MEQHLVTKEILTAISASLVLASVLLGVLSFNSTESGTPPDAYPQADYGLDLEFDKTVLEHARRERARLYAKVLFNLSAVAIAASVLVDLSTDAQGRIAVALISLASATILFDLIYLARSLYVAWRQRFAAAFEAFYYGKGYAKYYRNTDAARKLFASMNRLPPWRLFDSEWESTLRFPSAEEMLAADRGA